MCALVAAVVKTQRVFSSHGGFLACVKPESPFNKSTEKMLIYKKDSLYLDLCVLGDESWIS